MKCLECGKNIDVPVNFDDRSLKPKNGDIGICFFCGHVHQFVNGQIGPVDFDSLSIETQAEVVMLNRARCEAMKKMKQ